MGSCPSEGNGKVSPAAEPVRKQVQRKKKKNHLSGQKDKTRTVDVASLQSPDLAQSNTGLTPRVSLLDHKMSLMPRDRHHTRDVPSISRGQ